MWDPYFSGRMRGLKAGRYWLFTDVPIFHGKQMARFEGVLRWDVDRL
jgi:hypothetical protein